MSSLPSEYEVYQLIKSKKNKDFFDIVDQLFIENRSYEQFTEYYIKACRYGNLEVTIFLCENKDKYRVNIDFTTIETTSYGEEDRPNGALNWVISESHDDILEYFIIKNVYEICIDTKNHFDTYFSGWEEKIKEIEEKIELKLKLERELEQQSKEIISHKL